MIEYKISVSTLHVNYVCYHDSNNALGKEKGKLANTDH